MRKIWSQQSELVKNFLTLFSGTFLAQVAPFLASLLLARLFLPEEFGEFGVVMSMVSVCAVMISGRYELALVLPKSDRAGKAISVASMLFTLVYSVLLGIVAWIFWPQIGAYLQLQNPYWVLVVPGICFVAGIYNPFSYWLTRKKAFKRAAVNKVVQTWSLAGVSLVLGFLAVRSGLIYGYIAGWVLLTGFSIYQARLENWDLKGISWRAVRRMAHEFREFPLLNSLPALLNTLAPHMMVFYISHTFSQDEVGYYNYARQLLLGPLSMIATAFAQVYFQRIAEKKQDNESFYSEFRKLFLLLAGGGLLVALVVAFLGPWLFKTILGDIWEPSGQFARILVISYAIQFAVSPLSTILAALKEMKLATLFPILYFILMLVLYLLNMQDINRFIPWLTAFESVAYIIYGLIIWYAVRRYENRLNPR
ncbi:oligosaccharide flippase family protein [bacterium SCSIO 12741]|nr:oligosaccharide flippase family protein [bacterium SCSIO 12741]